MNEQPDKYIPDLTEDTWRLELRAKGSYGESLYVVSKKGNSMRSFVKLDSRSKSNNIASLYETDPLRVNKALICGFIEEDLAHSMSCVQNIEQAFTAFASSGHATFKAYPKNGDMKKVRPYYAWSVSDHCPLAAYYLLMDKLETDGVILRN